MEGGNRSNNSNEVQIVDINRENEFDRQLILSIMREVEATVNAGIYTPTPVQTSTEATTTETPQFEAEDAQHLVSSVTVSTRELHNLSENIGLRELDEQWRGESIDRTRIRVMRSDESSENEESDEDYLVTLTLAENVIVIRFIADFRPHAVPYCPTTTQIIWNSKFTWRDIKQHVENDTYKFYFKYEVIRIGITDFEEESVGSNSSEEEDTDSMSSFTDQEEEDIITSNTEGEEIQVNSGARAAVNALPAAIISRQEKESGDVVLCPICLEAFSIGDSAKQLPCAHSFHAKCFLLWFDRNHSCPICRREVVLLQDKLVVLNLNEPS